MQFAPPGADRKRLPWDQSTRRVCRESQTAFRTYAVNALRQCGLTKRAMSWLRLLTSSARYSDLTYWCVVGRVSPSRNAICCTESPASCTATADPLGSGDGQQRRRLRLRFINGFAPQPGQQFQLLDLGGSAQLSGASYKIHDLMPGFAFDVASTAGGVTLTAQTTGVFVPEPTAALLTALAVARVSLVLPPTGGRVLPRLP